MKKKILVVTGTRADYGLLKPVIQEMQKSSKMEPRLLITGMHTLKKFGYTLNEIKKDKFSIAAVVKVSVKDGMLQSLSKEISGIAEFCKANKVDYIFVLGDRDEALAGAVVGIHNNIPVIHFSGGDVSGPTVDYYLRNAITVFSKFHFTQTEKSRKNVIKLGADPRLCFIAGSLGLNGLSLSDFHGKKYVAEKLKLDKSQQWFLVVMHPTPLENVSLKGQIDPLLDLLKILPGEKIIIYPNSDTGCVYFIKKIKSLRKENYVHVMSNLTREIFLELLRNSDVFLGNSSAGLIEAEFTKTPFINIGNRQKGREFGANTVFSDYSKAGIQKALRTALSHEFRRKLKKSKPRYFGGKVAKKIVKTLEKLI